MKNRSISTSGIIRVDNIFRLNNDESARAFRERMPMTSDDFIMKRAVYINANFRRHAHTVSMLKAQLELSADELFRL